MSNGKNDYTGKLQAKPGEGEKFGKSFGKIGFNHNTKKSGNQPDFYGWLIIDEADLKIENGKVFLTFSAWKNGK